MVAEHLEMIPLLNIRLEIPETGADAQSIQQNVGSSEVQNYYCSQPDCRQDGKWRSNSARKSSGNYSESGAWDNPLHGISQVIWAFRTLPIRGKDI